MKALIDGDILAYAYGEIKKKEPEKDQEDLAPDTEVGEILPFELCFGVVENKIDECIRDTSADEYCIYLSHPEYKSWRYDISTIQDYKAQRAGKEKPEYWSFIRKNLEYHYNCVIAENIEADDAMSIEQYTDWFQCWKYQNGLSVEEKDGSTLNTIICSQDKDLNMVPGWHYSWSVGDKDAKGPWWQDELNGLRCFYKQLLIGDSTDNILGLFGVGQRAACVQRIDTYSTEQEMFNECYKRYSERFGNYAEQFMRETGLLLWMQTTREDRWDKFEELMHNANATVC